MARIEYVVPTDPAGNGRDLLKREPGTLIWRETGADGQPTVVKVYRRRGGASAARSFLFRFRAEREHRRLEHLRRCGVPCTEPLGWTHGYSRAHGFHEVLVTAEVPAAVPLDVFLATGAVEPSTLAPLFRLVRRMHESGLCHQALYASNILVRPGAALESRYVIADLPRSWTFPGSIVGTSMAALDVLDLVYTIVEAGVPLEAVPIEAYGPDGLTAHHWATDGGDLVKRGRSARTKGARGRRDLAARLRWVGAWGLRAGRWPGPTPPLSADVRRSLRSLFDAAPSARAFRRFALRARFSIGTEALPAHIEKGGAQPRPSKSERSERRKARAQPGVE
jgi:hypothetical protein